MNQRFEIGEEVLCIESTIGIQACTPVIKGKKYTVLAFEFCPSCGLQMIDVGVLNPIPERLMSGYYSCSKCNGRSKFVSPHTLSSNKFVRVQDVDNQLEIAVENENYELAQILHESKLSN